MVAQSEAVMATGVALMGAGIAAMAAVNGTTAGVWRRPRPCARSVHAIPAER